MKQPAAKKAVIVLETNPNENTILIMARSYVAEELKQYGKIEKRGKKSGVNLYLFTAQSLYDLADIKNYINSFNDDLPNTAEPWGH